MYLTIAVILFIIASGIILCEIRSANMKSDRDNQIDVDDTMLYIVTIGFLSLFWGAILPLFLTIQFVDCFIHNKDAREIDVLGIFGEDD